MEWNDQAVVWQRPEARVLGMGRRVVVEDHPRPGKRPGSKVERSERDAEREGARQVKGIRTKRRGRGVTNATSPDHGRTLMSRAASQRRGRSSSLSRVNEIGRAAFRSSKGCGTAVGARPSGNAQADRALNAVWVRFPLCKRKAPDGAAECRVTPGTSLRRREAKKGPNTWGLRPNQVLGRSATPTGFGGNSPAPGSTRASTG